MCEPTSTSPECKLNVMVNGDPVFVAVYPTYVKMMDDARAQRDKVEADHPGGFVVVQYQRMGPHGWFHGAILS